MFGKKKQKNKDKDSEAKNATQKKEKDYQKEIEENVNIYVMPERFRSVHVEKDKAKAMGLVIIIGGVIFLIAASALSYFYFFKEKEPAKTSQVATSTAPEVKEPTSTPKPTPTPTPEPTPAPEPEEVVKEPRESYIEIKMELDEANTFSAFEEVIIEYGTKNRITLLENEKNQVIGSLDNTESFVNQKNMPKIGELKDIKTSKAGNMSTLSVTLKDESMEGEVILRKEDGIWKLDSETWESTEVPVVVVPEVVTNGADADGDGLTDKEEGLFSSNSGVNDSDGDGYSDLSEIVNGYNPAGEGALSDNSNIKKHTNSTYAYNLMYPAIWTLNQIGGDESIIIKSTDNQFIQIIVQTNSNKQTIDDWYRMQFNESSISSARRINGNNWSGIKSEDGLIVYITDINSNYIFTISYSLGDSSVIEYKNIFNMLIDSFEVAIN